MTADPVARVRVAIERLPHGRDLGLPSYASAEAAGADLRAAIEADGPLLLAPGQRALVTTGIKIALPAGFEGQIRPRSGLALRHGITVLNAPGTIDSDYRGELMVILINLGDVSSSIVRGDRVAQLVVAPVVRASWDERSIEQLATLRGQAGFGSTGD